jgi:anti-sigma factor RsiW
MVAGTHPDDIDLFDYIEDDLPQARRAEIESHLSACSLCAEQVGRVEAGRDALRGAQFMHLPERRGEAIFMNLPTQVREPSRRRALTPKQLIAVLTPVIAIAAVIGVLVNTNSDSGQNSAAAPATDAAGGASSTRSAASPEAVQAATLFAGGTAADVADELQRKGFDAAVKGDQVVVKGATQKQVREALADRGPGDVQIVVKGR